MADQQHTCANPRCDEQFFSAEDGREFHSGDCRLAAEQDLRRIRAQLAHHERQVEHLRSRANAYPSSCGCSEIGGPTQGQLRTARDAVLEVAGMSGFLASQSGEFADDLLRLYRAVEPVVLHEERSPQWQQRSVGLSEL